LKWPGGSTDAGSADAVGRPSEASFGLEVKQESKDSIKLKVRVNGDQERGRVTLTHSAAQELQ
jgi:hypothetical protein